MTARRLHIDAVNRRSGFTVGLVSFGSLFTAAAKRVAAPYRGKGHSAAHATQYRLEGGVIE